MKSWLKDNIWLLPLLIANAAIRSYGIADPWLRGHRGFSGALSGIIARNYLRFGYLDTRFAPVWLAGPARQSELALHYHLRHPSLRYLIVSLFYRVFGISEWVTTLVPVLFSVGSAVVLYFLVKRIWGKWTALLAVAFLTLIPIDAYYGAQTSYEPIALFFSLISLLLYHLWLERRKRRLLIGLWVTLGLGAFAGYAGFFMIGLIGLHYLVFGPRGWRAVRLALGLWAYAVLLFVAWAAYAGVLLGSVQTFVAGWALRTGSAQAMQFTYESYYQVQYLRVREFFTPVLRVLALIWVVFCICDLRWGKKLLEHSYLVLLLIYGLLQVVIFCQGAWVHEYWLCFLAPFFAVAGAVAVESLGRVVLGGRKVLVAGLVIVVWAFYVPSAVGQLQVFYQPRDVAELELARHLHSRTEFNEGVLLGFEVLEPHFDYYLDRRRLLVEDVGDFERLAKTGDYRLCVLRSPRTVDERLVQTLMRDYPAEAFADYLVFDLVGKGERLVRQEVAPTHRLERSIVPGVELVGYDGPDQVRLFDREATNWLSRYLYSSSYQPERTEQQVKIVLYWRAEQGIEQDVQPALRLVGNDGLKRYVAEAKHGPVPRLYTTRLWKAGEVIVAPYWVEIGEDYPAGVYGLEVVTGDEGGAVPLGWITVERGPAVPGRAERPPVEREVQAPAGNGVDLVGYGTDREVYQAGDTVALKTFWQVKEQGAARSVSGCLKNGRYEMCRSLGVIGGSDGIVGSYYELGARLPLHPAMLGGQYEVMLKIGPQQWRDVNLGTVEVKEQGRVWRLAREGEADWEGDKVLGPGDDLKVKYTLVERVPVRLAVNWTGRAELAQTRVDAYWVREDGTEEYLGTREVSRGEPSRSEWAIGKGLAVKGQNELRIRVAREAEGIHRLGWRGLLERLMPDLFDEVGGPWSGTIQVDALSVERAWAETWAAYRDRIQTYSRREMWGEAVNVYEEAVKDGVRAESVEDLDLLTKLAQRTGLESMARQVAEEEKRLVPNPIGISLGGKVRLEGYEFRREGKSVTGRWFFRCLAAPAEDWTMWVHGVPGDVSLLTGAERDKGYVELDQRLDTSHWEVGRLYEVRVKRALKAGRYDIKLGLWRWEDGSRLWREDRPGEHEVDLGWVDIK